jgi:hypothetical protein
MKNLYRLFLLWLAFVPLSSFAQQDTARGKEYANPTVEGMARGRFLVLRYQRFFSHDFNSTNSNVSKLPGVGNANNEIETDNIAEIKGYIPIWNRPHFKTVLGVGYEREEYNFKDPEKLTYLYHVNLQDKGLKSLSAQLAFLHPMDDTHYWILRLKGQLNGDYTSDELDFNDYLKTTAEVFYGWKKSKTFSWGIGAQLGYTFGRKTIYPALMFNKTFNDHWGIESVFPAGARMRYNASEKSLFYFGYNLDGYSYNIKITKPPFANFKTIELRHNDVKINLRYEQEIYDFIWFALEGGYRTNISYDAFESGTKRKVELISTDAGGTPFAQVDFYFVVPRAFLKR